MVRIVSGLLLGRTKVEGVSVTIFRLTSSVEKVVGQGFVVTRPVLTVSKEDDSFRPFQIDLFGLERSLGVGVSITVQVDGSRPDPLP